MDRLELWIILRRVLFRGSVMLWIRFGCLFSYIFNLRPQEWSDRFPVHSSFYIKDSALIIFKHLEGGIKLVLVLLVKRLFLERLRWLRLLLQILSHWYFLAICPLLPWVLKCAIWVNIGSNDTPWRSLTILLLYLILSGIKRWDFPKQWEIPRKT